MSLAAIVVAAIGTAAAFVVPLWRSDVAMHAAYVVTSSICVLTCLLTTTYDIVHEPARGGNLIPTIAARISWVLAIGFGASVVQGVVVAIATRDVETAVRFSATCALFATHTTLILAPWAILLRTGLGPTAAPWGFAAIVLAALAAGPETAVSQGAAWLLPRFANSESDLSISYAAAYGAFVTAAASIGARRP